LLAGGCVVNDASSVKCSAKGAMVPQETLNQIEPGRTSKAKLVAILGEPTRKTKLDENTEWYVYEYTKTKKWDLTVLLLVRKKGTTRKTNRLYFEIRDDLVKRWWRDSVFD